MAEVITYKGLTKEHEHYVKLTIPNRGKWFYPVVRVKGYRRVMKKQFTRARDAEAWALRFERKLAAGAFAPVVKPIEPIASAPLKWYQSVWAWIVRLVKKARE